jgi:hypothetical protein
MKPWYKDLKVGDLVRFPVGTVMSYKIISLERNRVSVREKSSWRHESSWDAQYWDILVEEGRVQFVYNGLQLAIRKAKAQSAVLK